MIQITPQMRILVATKPADFRKGIDGLAQVCRKQLRSNPFSGTVFVFRNKAATAIKILIYDGQGFWLAQKRLSKGTFKFWPQSPLSTTSLKAHEIQILFQAGNPYKTQSAPLFLPV